MSLTFHVHRVIPAAEKKALFEWGTDIFSASLYNAKWRGTDHHVVGYVAGRPAVHVGLVAHRISVGSTKALVGGIGSVVTAPEFQKQGRARECLLWSHAYMQSELGVEFGYLFCPERLVKFYSSLGWKKLSDEVVVDQPGQTGVPAPLCSMVLEFSTPWPGGRVDLGSLPW